MIGFYVLLAIGPCYAGALLSLGLEPKPLASSTISTCTHAGNNMHKGAHIQSPLLRPQDGGSAKLGLPNQGPLTFFGLPRSFFFTLHMAIWPVAFPVRFF